MKRLFISAFVALFTLGVSAQDNMEAFKHLAVGVEAGLHGVGLEVAMPVHKHLVVRAGYNWMPSGDLVNGEFGIDTKDLKEAQQQYDAIMHFQHKFGDEAPISDEERQRRRNVARDRRMMSDVDNRDKTGRYDNDFDQEFRHTSAFAKRILRDRKPTLGADKEVPIIHGRRKSWKRRDLDEPTDK